MFSRETQALMEAAVDAIVVIDHRGRMLAVNDAARRMFGYRTDELLGENVSMLMPEPDRSAHDGYLARYLETGEAKIIGIGREVTAQRKDGTRFRRTFRWAASRMRARRVSSDRCATSPPNTRRRAALKLERDRANAYLELNDSILLDARRRSAAYVEINARGSDTARRTGPVDLHGRDWLDFIHGDAERERAPAHAHERTGQRQSREREFDALDASGDRAAHLLALHRAPRADGSPAGWLCSGTDVTDARCARSTRTWRRTG